MKNFLILAILLAICAVVAPTAFKYVISFMYQATILICSCFVEIIRLGINTIQHCV